MAPLSFKTKWLRQEARLLKKKGYPNLKDRIKLLNMSPNLVEQYEKNRIRIFARRYVAILLLIQFIVSIGFLFVICYFILVFSNYFINSHILK